MKMTNFLGGSRVDMRVQAKVLNVAVNTSLEYGFHTVHYNRKELERLDRKNKRVIKRMMRISIMCPSSIIHLREDRGGLGLRKLWDLYREINLSDLMEVMNFVGQEIVILYDDKTKNG
jgi:hypothetical protein